MSNELLGIGEARDGLGATPATAIWRQLAAIYSFRWWRFDRGRAKEWHQSST